MSSLTPIEAIDEFYKLKHKYETDYYEKYVKPIVKSNKTKREKRVEFSQLPKHDCVNCKRQVGTIFSVSNYEEDFKLYIAKCGDLNQPCELDIQIKYAKRDSMEETINEGLKSIDNLKLKIIKEKNNALFFNKDVVNTFDKLTEQLKGETENTGYAIEANILNNNNPEKRAFTKRKIIEFGSEIIPTYKNMIEQYMDSNNVVALNKAINYVLDEVEPKAKEIRQLKYLVNYVEYDENYTYDKSSLVSSVYKLIQRPNTLEMAEYTLEDDTVVSFVKGVKKEKKEKKTKKTLKVTDKLPNNKTKKIKETITLVEEKEEEPGSPEYAPTTGQEQ
jgi:hypothetical protein